MNGQPMRRRHLLQAAGGLTVTAAATPILAACASDSDDAGGDTSTTAGNATAGGGPSTTAGSPGAGGPSAPDASSVLPNFAAFTPAKPDLVGDPKKGIPDGFLSYPASPTQVHSAPPASGDPISILKLVSNAVPPPLSENKFWQELNKRVGAELKITNVINSDYPAKVATTIAGGDIPDLMQMSTSYISNIQGFLVKECQDLSEWMSGDAIHQFQSLASIPTVAWKNVVFNGGIYGVPYPLGVVGSDTKVRQDIADKLGVSTEPSNGQELMDMCKALTDPAKRRWALDQVNTAQSLVNESLGVPHAWKVEDGKFTNAIATDEYKQGLDICNQLWKANCVYPDSLSSTANFHAWFTSGQVMIEHDGFTNWASLTKQGLVADPDFRMGGIVTPKWEGGGQAAHYEGSGMYTFTVMKKQSSKDKVERLLRMLDWFATPYGTEEFRFVHSGIPGRDYTLEGTDAISTQTGINEVGYFNAGYIASTPLPLSSSGHPEVVKVDYEYLTKLMQVTAPLPTVGLISATALTKGASLNKVLIDARNDIVTGRKKVDSWDGVVKTWRSKGGADMEKEYTEAYAARAAN